MLGKWATYHITKSAGVDPPVPKSGGVATPPTPPVATPLGGVLRELLKLLLPWRLTARWEGVSRPVCTVQCVHTSSDGTGGLLGPAGSLRTRPSWLRRVSEPASLCHLPPGC